MKTEVTKKPNRGDPWILNPTDPQPVQPDKDSFVVTHTASEKFIDCLQQERRRGYGFVPIIGAGFSAPSGAPLVNEFGKYLQRCIWLALGNENPDGHRWHPRTDQWPPFLHRGQDKERRDYQQRLLDLLSSLRGTNGKSRNGQGPAKEQQETLVLGEGIGAMSEWRSSLLFLTRLKHEPRKNHGLLQGPEHGSNNRNYCQASLGAPRPEIRDSCFREVLKGNSPALNHTMLGVLAGAMRLNLILTTNFDDLLEIAFADARNPLQVFEVHLEDHLPHWTAVSDIRSLVKFHGNRHSLRADYSLDAAPSEHDKKRFLEYLVAGPIRETPRGPSGMPFQNHLLVMGASGKERRTLDLIEYAGEHLNREFTVFWLCYSDDDVVEIRNFARNWYQTQGHSRPSFVVLKHTNHGLLLLQLYQTIRQSLPPFGGLFPSVSRLTLPPLPQPPNEKREGRSFCRELADRLQNFGQDGTAKLIVITAEDEVRGMTSACIKVFHQMESSDVCIWLDMNDISSADNLFEVLLEAAYFRLGQDNWVPTYRETDGERTGGRRTKEIAHVMSTVDRPWIIFLNARETPGANTGVPVFDRDRPHGWLDADGTRTEESDCAEAFVELVEQLSDTPNISVVLMCRAETTANGERTGLMRELKHKGLLEENRVSLDEDMREVRSFLEQDVVDSAIRWAGTDKQKRRFLHALVLMQRPRLLSTIWSDAVLPVRGERSGNTDKRQKWLNELEGRGLLRRKAGGFIWLHSRCRELIRRVLRDSKELKKWESASKYAAAEKILRNWKAKGVEPEIHTLLAKWYEKVLDASGAPAAVFEAVYHLCRAAEGYLEPTVDPRQGIVKACQRLDAATALLKVNSFLLQAQGYPRASWRRLGYTRDELCIGLAEKKRDSVALQAAAQRLRVTCTEVMRAIAQEVGEDKKAYLLHQQFAILQTQECVERLPQEGDAHFSQDLLRALSAASGEACPPAAVPVLLRGGGSTAKKSAGSDWVRWWRWSGMLATSTRSYGSASSAFRRALHCVAYPLTYPESTNSVWPPDSAETERRVYQSSPELKVEALRTLEQHVELELIKYSLEQRIEKLPEHRAADDCEGWLTKIEKRIARGRALASNVRGGNSPHDPRNTVEANWCESRLLMHLSVCMSRRQQLEGSEEIHRPLGLLADAEAILRISDPRRHRSDIAMVELHRSQARLWAAEGVPMKETPRNEGSKASTESFGELCQRLTQCPANDLSRLSDFAVAGLRRAKSLVADGIHFLDRVEPMLRERRRNVWWTTWFFERYLRAIAMSVWATVFERGSPIPFLGLEAAASGTPSMADELLYNAERMISVDTYRMATIVDAYASCAKALQVRLTLDEDSPRLPDRLKGMREKLKGARAELSRVKKRRDDSAFGTRRKRNEKTAMDPHVATYVRQVRDRSGLIYKDLRAGSSRRS